jgi:mRNA interferase MazF
MSVGKSSTSGSLSSYVPDRGHLVWIDFSPQAGREQRGHRPALVLSAKNFNRLTGFALVCPLTRKRKGRYFEAHIDKVGAMPGGAVLIDHVRSLDWQARGARFIAEAPPALVADVAGQVIAILDPDRAPARVASVSPQVNAGTSP